MAKRAVVLEPEERKSRAAIQMLSTIRKDKSERRHEAAENRQKRKAQEASKETARFEEVHKETKKRAFREKGLEMSKRQKKMN